MSKAKEIVARAKRLTARSATWADLSNALFDPLDGLVGKHFPDAAERAAFRKSKEYDALHGLVERKMEETGVVEGAVPRKSGRFVVRLPRSLHAALEKEARAEGTSLNQLVLTKLAVQLSCVAPGKTASIIQAFAEVRNAYSADRVVADPDLDRKFLRRCRELGLSGTDYELNWALLNARKAGHMSHLPRTKRYTVRETDDFEYASELAVRHLQLTKSVSLDQIICDPDLTQEFDQYAMRLAPGFSPLQYRWVALGLRKAGRLRTRCAGDLDAPRLEPLCSLPQLEPNTVPEESGIYLFSSGGSPIFLSHTDNLRHRLERHIESSESRGLPSWLWDEGSLDLSVAPMPGVSRQLRQSAEIMLVTQMHPLLNYSRTAA